MKGRKRVNSRTTSRGRRLAARLDGGGRLERHAQPDRTAPDAAALLALPDAHVHLYGKTPRRGRKLGHVTLRAADVEEALRRLVEVRKLVGSGI